ncbi:hypothetical protein [Pseudooceanicola sp. 200-1SW]|uniref:hypothetical protein n=1 Tax=Pseudooceanicola sp. 200-1SW TaxID=3425949 RepID=UPI003D7F91EE
MTVKPEFTRTISIGNWLQLLVLVVGGTGAFVATQASTENNAIEIVRLREDMAEKVAAAQSDLAEAETRIASLEAETRSMGNQLARADERFSSILGLLARIDARLERIERTPDGR